MQIEGSTETQNTKKFQLQFSSKQKWFFILFLISTAISLTLFLTIVNDDVHFQTSLVETDCRFLSTQISTRRCCDIESFNQCIIEVPTTAPLCFDYQQQLLNISICNNKYLCCDYHCQTCSRLVSCGRYICTQTYDCNCGCYQSIDNSFGAVLCGTCYTITT